MNTRTYILQMSDETRNTLMMVLRDYIDAKVPIPSDSDAKVGRRVRRIRDVVKQIHDATQPQPREEHSSKGNYSISPIDSTDLI